MYGLPYSRFVMYLGEANRQQREALRAQLVVARTAQAADGQPVTDLLRELGAD